jgi:hypothetical protein
MSVNEYVATWLHSQQVFGPLAVVHMERNAIVIVIVELRYPVQVRGIAVPGEVMPHVKIARLLAAATDRQRLCS